MVLFVISFSSFSFHVIIKTFFSDESSLPLVDWLSDPIFLEESNSSILNITNDTLSADSDSTFLDYLMNECYEMVNSPSFAEIIFPLLPKGRDFELTSLELRLQSIHSSEWKTSWKKNDTRDTQMHRV